MSGNPGLGRGLSPNEADFLLQLRGVGVERVGGELVPAKDQKLLCSRIRHRSELLARFGLAVVESFAHAVPFHNPVGFWSTP